LIAIDICNTIADVNSAIANRFSLSFEKYPLPVPDEFWMSEKGTDVFKKVLPIEGAAEVVSDVSELLGGVVYVTTRPKKIEFVTRQWLKKHGFPKGSVIFCSRKEKPLIYSILQPSIIAEDDPEVIVELQKLDVSPVLVYQWPYNRHLRGSNIVPVGQWDTNQERGVSCWL